jgi:hypothetical protein
MLRSFDFDPVFIRTGIMQLPAAEHFLSGGLSFIRAQLGGGREGAAQPLFGKPRRPPPPKKESLVFRGSRFAARCFLGKGVQVQVQLFSGHFHKLVVALKAQIELSLLSVERFEMLLPIPSSVVVCWSTVVLI